MNFKLLFPLIMLCTVASAAPPTIRDRVETLRKQIGIPGMAMAIVENDKVTFARGFGVQAAWMHPSRWMPTRFSRPARPARPSPSPRSACWSMPARSTGMTGSSTSLPGFQMYDPWVTREMTIRDLLVHRSGLGLGRRRSAVRAAHEPKPRRIGAAAALHQARDQLSQWLSPTTTFCTWSRAS